MIDFMRSTVALPKGVALGRNRPGAAIVRMDSSHPPLLTIGTRVQGVAVKTIIDTGADATLGNLALHYALTNKAVDTSERVELVGRGRTRTDRDPSTVTHDGNRPAANFWGHVSPMATYPCSST